jgi:ribonuclease P/MRP protein subunit POP1
VGSKSQPISHASDEMLIPDMISNSRYESGARIARTTIHHQSQWPRGLVGPLDLLWRGHSTSDTDHPDVRQVWLRFHPAMFEETWQALRDSLIAVRSVMSVESREVPSVKISDLRGEINCFEIMGPKAGLVLQGITAACKSESNSKHKVSRGIQVMVSCCQADCQIY